MKSPPLKPESRIPNPESQGAVVSLNISKRKGVAKRPVPEASLVVGVGLSGDAHAGSGDREISLLAEEAIEAQRLWMEQRRESDPTCPKTPHGMELRPGVFAENITTRGVPLSNLPIGTRLAIGDTAVLEITRIGKECHRRCAIYYKTGDCIMPREGVFARVVRAGEVKPGDAIIYTSGGPDGERPRRARRAGG